MLTLQVHPAPFYRKHAPMHMNLVTLRQHLFLILAWNTSSVYRNWNLILANLHDKPSYLYYNSANIWSSSCLDNWSSSYPNNWSLSCKNHLSISWSHGNIKINSISHPMQLHHPGYHYNQLPQSHEEGFASSSIKDDPFLPTFSSSPTPQNPIPLMIG